MSENENITNNGNNEKENVKKIEKNIKNSSKAEADVDVKNSKENIAKAEKKKKDSKSSMKKFKEFCLKHSVATYTVIGVTLFFLSMMLAAQMKVVSNTEEVLQGKREAQLADDLVNLQKKYNDLKEKYEKSEEIVDEYQTNASSNDTLIRSMKQQLEDLNLLSGTTDIKGEGIVITLNDGLKGVVIEGNSDTLVHDSDILTVVNELKAAGAEAISVNGQRIISTSAIRCVGPVIQVNYQKVAAPFEIKAIGNAQYLESAMNIKNGIVDTLKELGIGVTVSREPEVKIPKYEGVMTFEHAEEDK